MKQNVACGLSETEWGLSETECGLSETEWELSETECGLSETEWGLSDTECGLSGKQNVASVKQNVHSKASFFCVGEYAKYGFDQQG